MFFNDRFWPLADIEEHVKSLNSAICWDKNGAQESVTALYKQLNTTIYGKSKVENGLF